MSKENIILKLSGGYFKGEGKALDEAKFHDVAKKIVNLKEKYNIAIVVGGGNIWRGKNARAYHLDEDEADYLGMSSTIYNGVLLAAILDGAGIGVSVYSKLEFDKLVEKFKKKRVEKDLNNGNIVIVVGGSGEVGYSTDTAAAILAKELGIKNIYVAKNKVDGVYSDDPNKNKEAKKYEKISYKEYLASKLEVLDGSAVEICQKNQIKILVFDMNELDNIKEEIIGTIIEGE